MKSFAYEAPTTLGDALTMLAEPHRRVRPLAGGTDLLVQMRLNLYDVDLVVDVKKIPELNQLAYDEVDGLTIGAAVPCARIYETPAVTGPLSGPGGCGFDYRRHCHSGPGHPGGQCV
jgi:CO/xanthine dehydrogenase FAD-binding subunit